MVKLPLKTGECEFESHLEGVVYFGELSEWFMVAVLKTVERGDPLRGFESYTLRKQVGLQSNEFLTQYYKHFVVAATGDVKRASSRWYNTLS